MRSPWGSSSGPNPSLEFTVRRSPLLVAVVTSAALVLAACAGADAADQPSADTAQPGVVTVDAEAAVSLLDSRDDLAVIDVRAPEEYAAGHLPGAELVDIYEPAFTDEIDGLDREGSYLLYCRTGSRSGQAAALMEELGFTEVYDAGGLDDLERAGAHVER